MIRTRIPIIILLVVLGLNGSVQAWGPEGHGIIGVIADRYLTPTTREKIEELLEDDHLGTPEIACWPDIIRGTKEYDEIYPKNGLWHYVDFDASLRYTKDFSLKMPEGKDNVVDQVVRWQKELADPDSSPRQKLDALRFLVHFVGDLHQPLHCAYRYNDMGGNMLPVHSFLGSNYSFDAETPMDYPPSLHSVWDSSLVLELMGKQRVKTTARKLRKEIKRDNLQNWSQGDAFDWATESYWIARKQAYRWTNGDPVPFKWALPGMDLTMDNYIASKLPFVGEQLKKGGIRLARLLNEALDPEYQPPAPPAEK
ncbi:MAG: S1/P1 nuclease [Kiritimatiellae bacterium]|nr:S1/P1 nuclease [Kiritimatiellia bacterium]